MYKHHFHVLYMATELPQVLAVVSGPLCVRELCSIGKWNADTRMANRLAADQSFPMNFGVARHIGSQYWTLI